MTTSENVYTFHPASVGGYELLTVQQWPWCVLQVVRTTPGDFARTVERLKKRGFVATHDRDRTFCIIHLGSGDTDGQHPEHRVNLTPATARKFTDTLKDIMAQAAVWYYTNIIL